MDSSLRIKYEDPQLLRLLRQRENNVSIEIFF